MTVKDVYENYRRARELIDHARRERAWMQTMAPSNEATVNPYQQIGQEITRRIT